MVINNLQENVINDVTLDHCSGGASQRDVMSSMRYLVNKSRVNRRRSCNYDDGDDFDDNDDDGWQERNLLALTSRDEYDDPINEIRPVSYSSFSAATTGRTSLEMHKMCPICLLQQTYNSPASAVETTTVDRNDMSNRHEMSIESNSRPDLLPKRRRRPRDRGSTLPDSWPDLPLTSAVCRDALETSMDVLMMTAVSVIGDGDFRRNISSSAPDLIGATSAATTALVTCKSSTLKLNTMK